MKKRLILLGTIFVSFLSFAQVGINTSSPNTDAALDVVSNTKGILNTRIALSSTSSPSPLSAHVAGMMVYNTASVSDVTPGLYYNDGSKWVRAGGSSASNPPLNVIYQNGSYTALPTDDIILYTNNTVGTRLTLPTTGVAVGKKIYVSLIGSEDVLLTPVPRETANQYLISGQSNILMYTGDATSPWSIISGY
ncbi:hypothetical protein HNP38_000817 [Chryseobacterium defluvii]|uniref:Uncharacterized protein n=1 Tax=Chryseobacterium defluvii TaxID=160396 RepID=A0A840KAS7_9FLAO|nr:hypothetical protein [Chryseobacterium defluvii]MBB4805545.1 hypothetical protein [Chryseobacterium defluvii]